MIDLKPCPFCGGEPSTRTYETESLWSKNQVTRTVVECGECELGFSTEPGYEFEAPEAWNRRASPWLTIDTAPKDGTVVLLFCPQSDGSPGSEYRVTCGNWHVDPGGTTVYRDADGRYIDQDDHDYWEGWLSWDGGFSEETMLPTHWMPMPAPHIEEPQ